VVVAHVLAPCAHARLALCAFQRHAAYRLANLTGVAVNFFFFLIHAQVFLAFFEGRGQVVGWTGRDAVLYFAASEALMMALGLMSPAVAQQLADRVRSGDIVVDLARPLRLWTRHTAEAYGTALYYLLARSILLFGAAVWIYELALPMSPRLLWLPLSLALAVTASALMGYIAAATAYWIEHPRGPIMTSMVLALALGGVMVPLDFYPDAVRTVCDIAPFRAMAYTPLALAAGKLADAALAWALAHQVAWVLLLAAAAHAMERTGTRRLAALGG
jgi:ABC-2 type transport system permease protein